MYGHQEIMRILGPKFTHVMVDKVLYCQPGEYIYALKNVSLSDIGYGNGALKLASTHVFIVIESICQLANLFLEVSDWNHEVDSVSMGGFAYKAEPGDTLCLELQIPPESDEANWLEARIIKDGQLICSPKISLAAR